MADVVLHVLTGESPVLHARIMADMPSDTKTMKHGDDTIYYTGDGPEDEIISDARALVERAEEEEGDCQCEECQRVDDF